MFPVIKLKKNDFFKTSTLALTTFMFYPTEQYNLIFFVNSRFAFKSRLCFSMVYVIIMIKKRGLGVLPVP